MAEKSAGSQLTLWRLFGWMRSSPINLTKQEREKSFGNLGELLSKRAARSYYHEQITPQTDIIGHMVEMQEMARSDIINPLLDLYAEECTQPDVNTEKIVWYECSDGGVEEELNNMLERIRVDDQIYSIAFNVAATGNDYRRILRSEENGIEQMVGVDVGDMERLYDETTRKLIGFRWRDQEPTEENGLRLGESTASMIFAPWEFVHFRRLVHSDTEYGVSILDSVWSLYRKIKMAMDQMVQYRLHMMPTRHAIMIDTGDQTILESAETVNILRNLVRNAVLIDPAEGVLESRFNPPGLDSMLYFPKRTDENTEITTLPGDKDVPDVYDLDLLFKQLFASSRIPKAYMGFEENTGIAQASLVSQDIRFARMVRVLRKPLIQGFHRLAELQLAFKGLDPSNYKIEVHMSKISSIEEEMNATMLEKQAAFASTLTGICQTLEIPNREIIDLVFREYLHVPRRFVDLAKLAAAVEQAIGGSGEEEEMAGGAPFGGGLGGGDFGDLGGDLGGGELDSLGDELGVEGGGGDEEISLESNIRRRKPVPLTEGTARRMANVLKTISSKRRSLTEGRLTEEQKKAVEVRENALDVRLWEMRQAVKSISDMTLQGRTSLVEPFTATVGRVNTESALPVKETLAETKQGLVELGKAAIKKPSIFEEQKTKGETHPAVKARQNMRESARK